LTAWIIQQQRERRASDQLKEEDNGGDEGSDSGAGKEAGAAAVTGEEQGLATERPVPTLRVLTSTQPAVLAAANVVAAAVPECSVVAQSGLNPISRGSSGAAGSAAAITEDPLASMGFHERFPGGESFADLVRRLEPSLLDIEASTDPVLVMATSTPCRALRAYALNLPVVEVMGAASSSAATALANDTHCVVELMPKPAGGMTERVHYLN